MTYTHPRGTKDILPEEAHLWQHVEKTALELFDVFHYNEIRTPIFESTGLFERGIGDDTDIVDKEMYTFEDKGGRSITLRPEGTAPVVRACIQHNLLHRNQRQKLFYKGPYFRYERPQAGRYRQFHQMGVENLGSAHPQADAEVIALGVRIFDKLGLKNLEVGINSVGCHLCRPVFEERLRQFIGQNLKQLCGNCQDRFDSNPLRILDCKNKTCKPYFSGMPDIKASLCTDCKDHFHTVTDYLNQVEIKFKVDPRLVRGLDYYTRTTFEIVSTQLGAQNAICGGGRYDKLVEQLGGPATPAVGFAFGMERAVLALQESKINVPIPKDIKIVLAPIGAEQKLVCFHILDLLRKADIVADMNYEKEDLKSHLKYASKLEATHTVIFGEQEAETHKAIIKDMSNSQQETVDLDEVVNHFLCLTSSQQ